MFPADAGMNRVVDFLFAMQNGVPRRRGDEPGRNRDTNRTQCVFPADEGMNGRGIIVWVVAECSPQTRG